MSRFALLLAATSLAAACGLSNAIAEPANATGRKAPMHPSTLTLRNGARPGQHRGHHHYAHDTLRQTTPIHGTMAGPRM